MLNGFEKIKVFFFLGLITLTIFFFLGTKRLTDKHLIILGVFLLWAAVSFLVNQDINPYFWYGNGEKWHGWYLYLGLLILWVILSSNT
jgi:hypothetical protein